MGPRPGRSRQATVVLLGVWGAVLLGVTTLGGGLLTRSLVTVPTPASDRQVQAFVARAYAGLTGSFTTSYVANFGARRITVYGAQLSQTVTMYRETPPIAWFARPGKGAPYSYEVFEVLGPNARHVAGVADGFYTCTLRTLGGRWSCQGPYRHFGMGVAFQLTAPYPPPELARGLAGAVYAYLGLPGGVIGGPGEQAYFLLESARGYRKVCLGFGPQRQFVGSVCLGPHDLVSYYNLPRAVTADTYVSAEMLHFSAHVPEGVFRLPAAPVPAHP